MANEGIKCLIKRHRLFRYEVAEAAGISEGFVNLAAETAHSGRRSPNQGSNRPVS